MSDGPPPHHTPWVRPPRLSRADFVRDVRRAVAERAGYGAGKLGASEKHWMYHPIFLARGPSKQQLAAYHLTLRIHASRQSGLFPADPDFLLEFNRFYLDHVRSLTTLGLFLEPREAELVHFHQLRNQFVFYTDQEPDRSSPSVASNCYLPAFAGKRLLLVSSCAELLRQRATEEIFEGVWAKSQKRWFHPASVEAVEFPYSYSPETRARYATVLDLYHDITKRIDAAHFDVALIAAGGLGIPLASHIQRSGRVAISLGGHLQIVFGVLGERWRHRADWQRRYFNEWWIDMPARYRPAGASVDELVDDGAYW